MEESSLEISCSENRPQTQNCDVTLSIFYFLHLAMIWLGAVIMLLHYYVVKFLTLGNTIKAGQHHFHSIKGNRIKFKSVGKPAIIITRNNTRIEATQLIFGKCTAILPSVMCTQLCMHPRGHHQLIVNNNALLIS